MDNGSAWDLLRSFFEIVAINVVLSGDNAVVIALACRSLPARQQRQAFIIGSIGAIVPRTALTVCAAYVMSLRYVAIVGSVLLLWIGVKLLLPENAGKEQAESPHLSDAVRTIIIADIVMSLDNVLGIAGAANGHLGMLVLGLCMTVPLILFCSALIIRLMERFPAFVTLGGALLGYVAGEMAVGDPAVTGWLAANAPLVPIILPIAMAGLVVVLGKLIGRRRKASAAKLAHPAE